MKPQVYVHFEIERNSKNMDSSYHGPGVWATHQKLAPFFARDSTELTGKQ